MAPLDGVDANDRQMSLKGDTLIKAASRSIESAAETSARPGRILQTTTPFHFRVGRGRGPPRWKEEADGGALICPSRDLWLAGPGHVSFVPPRQLDESSWIHLLIRFDESVEDVFGGRSYLVVKFRRLVVGVEMGRFVKISYLGWILPFSAV